MQVCPNAIIVIDSDRTILTATQMLGVLVCYLISEKHGVNAESRTQLSRTSGEHTHSGNAYHSLSSPSVL